MDQAGESAATGRAAATARRARPPLPWIAAAWGAAGAGCVALGAALHDPFPWILLTLALAAGLSGALCASLGVRRALAGMATLLVGLAAAELLMLTVFATKALDGRTEYGALFAWRPGLGGTPRPGAWRCTGWLGMRRLYDVSYGIDGQGRRVTGSVGDSAARAALCFGGSFTFGEGLADEQTWPWRLEEALQGELAVENLAAPGWGPSQMLALVDAWPAPGPGDPTPALAVYLAILGHPQRVSGETSWARGSPRYVLAADGDVERRGSFGDDAAPPPPGLPDRVAASALRTLRRSALLRRLIGTGRPRRAAHHDDQLPLWTAVVERSATLLHTRFPDLRFVVLFWDDAAPGDAQWERQEAMIGALVARGLEVERCSRWLSDLPRDPTWVLPGDGHPSPQAAAALAHGLANWWRAEGR